jgi:hypothetical protein
LAVVKRNAGWGRGAGAHGHNDGADTLLRIIVAITDLGTPPTDARH